MRKLTVAASIVLAAVGITVLGLFGAYGYGRDYYLHRGFAAVVQLPRAGTGRLLAVNYYSTALHRRADYMVYLPPGYSTHRRYPVYYLLHGMPGKPKVFVDIANMDVRLDNQLALGHARPMILASSRRTDRRQCVLRLRMGQHALGQLRELCDRGDAQRRSALCHASHAGRSGSSPASPRVPTARSTSRCTTCRTSPTCRRGRATSPRPGQECSHRPAARPSLTTARTSTWPGTRGRWLGIRSRLHVPGATTARAANSCRWPARSGQPASRSTTVSFRVGTTGRSGTRLNQMLDLASQDAAHPPSAVAAVALRAGQRAADGAARVSSPPSPLRAPAGGRAAAGTDLRHADQHRIRPAAPRRCARSSRQPRGAGQRLSRADLAARAGRRVDRLRRADPRRRAGAAYPRAGI